MEYFGYFAILITILYFIREFKNKFTISNIKNGQQTIINHDKIDKQIFK